MEPLGFAPRSLRRVAWAMIVYGIAGLVVAAALVIAGVATVQRWDRFAARYEAGRASIGATLDSASRIVATTADTVGDGSASLQAARSSLDDAASLMGAVGAGARTIADLSDFEVLGRQPFAELGPPLREVAARSADLAVSLQGAAASVGNLDARTGPLVAQLTDLSARLASNRDQVEALPAAADLADVLLPLLLVGAVLAVWMLIPSVLALVVGWRLLRQRPGNAAVG